MLVSDGEDTCAPPDPCQVARDLEASGVDVRVETVGLFLEANPLADRQLRCIAESTGGSYRTASDSAQLASELSQLSSRAYRQFQTQGNVVQGAAAAVDAPVLTPGTYSDTILAQEANWYSVHLQQGQELWATVTRAGVPEVNGTMNDPYLEVKVADPYLVERGYFDDGFVRQQGAAYLAQSVRIRTGAVGFRPPSRRYGAVLQRGRYYVRVFQEETISGAGVFGSQEIPIELLLQVTGQPPRPAPTPSPTPTPTPTATATATATPPADPPPTAQPIMPVAAAQPSAGAAATTSLVVGLLVVLIALAAAILVVLLTRRRPRRD